MSATDDVEHVPREHLLQSLTGIRASKGTYYREYRDKARRLDRAIQSIANISAALSNTTNGIPPLASAVVRVAAQHFDADWAILVLNDRSEQRWIAQHNATELIVLESGIVPGHLEAMLRDVREQPRLVVIDDGNTALLGTPMFLNDEVVGALAVAPRPGFTLDDREILVLQTLANQAAVALDNALLYAESERLRAQATALYQATLEQKTELEQKNRQLEQASRRLAVAHESEIVNNERSRIARELHDSVAQHLLSIGMNLEWCRAQLAAQEPVYERISATKELARSAVAHIRSVIFELSALTNDQGGLVAALQELSDDFAQMMGLPVALQVFGEPCNLSTEVEHAVYHIAQEALFNAYKHAQAQTVNINIHFKRHALLLLILDDGVGIADVYLQRKPTQLQTSHAQHYGLRNMRERAREIGGTCTIARRPHGGTEVRVRVPLPQHS